MKELEEARKIFLSPELDEESRKENEEVIADWEKALRETEGYADWQGHDISKQILEKAKATYLEASLILSRNRLLTDTERFSLWGKQDAALFIISLIGKDAKAELEQLKGRILSALSQA